MARIVLIVGAALLIGFGVAFALLNVISWDNEDAAAYWNAAMRLREGEPLYPPLSDPNAPDVYRYAPWFAWAWVPLTYLPQDLVLAVWSAVLLAAVIVAVWPLVRPDLLSVALAVFFAGLLLRTASTGNVQPLIIAALAWRVAKGDGPMWVAVTASLKVAPILLVAVYAGQREWRKVLIALGLTAVLVAPTLLYDVSHYPREVGFTTGLRPPLLVVAALGLAAAVWAYRLARRDHPWTWTVAGLSVALAFPRWTYLSPTWLLTGSADLERPEVASRTGRDGRRRLRLGVDLDVLRRG